MLMGRRPRSALDLLYPAVSSKVEDQQSRQNCHDSSSSSTRLFAVNDLVFAKNWVPGRVVTVTGPLLYEIELLQGGTIRRHVDAVRCREPAVTSEPAVTPETDDGELDWVPDEIMLSSPTPSSEGPPPKSTDSPCSSFYSNNSAARQILSVNIYCIGFLGVFFVCDCTCKILEGGSVV